ncbi:hypothetical protein Lal_00034850 [Lupinus albus]|nr:hypothetical protein Lal_00034850 [Lupinus albus]
MITYVVIFCLSWIILCSATFVQSQSTDDSSCDFFSGSWVHDDTYPLYDTSLCPFIGNQFDCKKKGRPDTDYLKLKWKPTHCELPRFDGNDFLKRYTGKKILFVGDSITNNQWQSLICLLHVAVPQSEYKVSARKFYLPGMEMYQEYDIHVDRLVHQYLVDLVEQDMGTVLQLDSISKNGEEFKGYDILIFDSWHWWNRNDTRKLWDYIQDGTQIVKDMDRLVAYKKALTTWSKWVESNVDSNVTQVFFQGLTPSHTSGKTWNDANPGVSCKGQTEPIDFSSYPQEPLPQGVAILNEVLANMTKPVTLLNVTTLSQFRKDGHPSIYGQYGEEKNDCLHWCVSGVPDTWNQILYAKLVAAGN